MIRDRHDLPPYPGPPVGGHDPRDVLASVRRLEAEVEGVRRRADREDDVADLRRELRETLARDRQAAVEDLEVVVDLIGTAWRQTSAQISALAAEVASLREAADDVRRALSGARLELRLDPAGWNGGADHAPGPNGAHAAPVAPPEAAGG